MILWLEPDMISYNAAILFQDMWICLQEMWILRLEPDIISSNPATSYMPQK